MGRLTAAPELKATQSGVSVTAFCLAVDRNYQQDGKRPTDFINCVAWRSTAEFITKHFGKGDMLAVTGEIQTRKYQDKDGNSRTAFEVVINQASFCGGKNNGDQTATPAFSANENNNFETLGENEDLPF